MARDAFEYDVGGELRDRYGRKQFVLTPKHTSPLNTDTIRGYTPTDADGRDQIVILGPNGNNLLTGSAADDVFPISAGTGQRMNGGGVPGVALTQAAGGQTLLYLDRHIGSDANTGLSPGAALATMDKAVQILNQGGIGGTIFVSSVQPGPYTLLAPIHAVVPITIQSLSPINNELDRGFGTPNSRSMWDAVTTLAGTTITSATAAFTGADVNRVIEVYGAGTGGGTYYDIISSVTDSSHVVVANGSGTAVARPAANDTAAVGIRMRIYGDWNRVVTDAVMSSTVNPSSLQSATAAFTIADVGTEVVVQGAGHGGQALRATIASFQSATQVTILGKAFTTVSGARCVIGLIAGDMITWHVPNCGLVNMYLYDPTIAQTRVGAALKYTVDDGYFQSAGQHVLQNTIISNGDPAGAWEHGWEVDGSWNQTPGGGGVRKTDARGLIVFGCRRPTEAIRLNTPVHMYVTGGGSGGAAPTTNVAQGVMILDPGHTRAGGSAAVADVHFAGFDGIDCSYYSEGQYTTWVGGRLGLASVTIPTGRFSIHLGIMSANCFVSCMNNDASQGATQTAQNDSGTANLIWTNRDANNTLMDAGSNAAPFTFSPKIDVARLFKITMTSVGTLTIGAPSRVAGTLGTSPRGMIVTFEIVNATGGVLTVSWSGSYKQVYTAPANTKTNVIAFIYDGVTWNQMAAQGPDF